ncbi:MAG: late competence development ComFB family protein [Synergistetes bacterium]|nr:late competence development ComFB family protein [Synergistota bacterium]
MPRNYMEKVVKETLMRLLKEREDICKCEKCIMDMMAYALNRLPPKYMVTDRGYIFLKLKEIEVQFQVDVLEAVLEAISVVSKRPEHCESSKNAG